MLKGKNIILGITGGIAAYKAAILVRMLVKNGAEVKVVMTDLAKKFITPLTMATLSKHPVLVDFFNPENGEWNSHVDLGLWADAYVIAPATANTMAKMTHGIADNLLLTTYLSARCPVFIAPAMDLDMYKHEATQNNISILKDRGHTLIEPAEGELASGLEGKGRMEEPEVIFNALVEYFNTKKNLLAGKKVLITAGPTYELIDPVRFISNFSTGKMGYALAETASNHGAEVKIISGPVNIECPCGVQVKNVTTASEMFIETTKIADDYDIIILAAAVADFTPEQKSTEKIKNKDDAFSIQLKPTKDIAEHVGKNKKANQLVVGFALETGNEIENAKAKLVKKNFDYIVLNSLKDEGAGFGYDTNKVSIINSKGNVESLELKPKSEVANEIIKRIVQTK
ncbi:MAG: bifunctional phosphopantothenoylcysteine decarboxylase/phosphopantothenate--cysteine ligase CoaBC [Bacteroidales bacterium]|nr:bifunctional phosphopantothenoylcysteine decarboxylase/phosphopantothenate--cysteine ligase CoaBC [Bacteroidales bacterium]